MNISQVPDHKPGPGELVLCVPSGWETYISLEFHEIHQALVARGWTRLVIDEVEDIVILKAICQARVALLWEAYELFERNAAALCANNDMTAPRKIVFCDDVHYFTPHRQQQRLRAFHWADLILATYPDKLVQWFPEIATKPINWTPHAAASCFQPAITKRVSDKILLSGSRAWPYPFRQFCQAKLPDAICEVVDHPGYPGYPGDRTNTMQADPEGMRSLGRERYAALLCNYPAMLVCGSIFGYLVAKVFEAMAAGCLVIAERSSLGERLSALGFIEGEHYVGTDLLHVIEDATRVRDGFLQGNPAGPCIASNAMHKVADLHTTVMRAAQIHHLCTRWGAS